MTTPIIQNAFAAGEISPSLFGRCDLAKFHVAATTLRNCTVNYRGGANSRAGTAYVLASKQSWTSGFQPRLITFQYAVNQGYVLELGDHYMRFYYQGAPILEASVVISAATQANPCVVTANAHGFSNGDWVFITGIVGMTQLNNRFFIVGGATANTFTPVSLFTGATINSTLYSAYASGGTVARVYTISAPWGGADLPAVKFTQSADVMSFAHPSYPSYDLARIAANNWTLGVVTIGNQLSPPGSPTATATVAADGTTTFAAAYAYVVTAVDAFGNESIASPRADVVNSVDMAITAGSIKVVWPAAASAVTYNVYRAPTSYNTDTPTAAAPVPAGAIFSYVGTSYGGEFVDSNTIPDTSKVPPIHKNPFAPGQILLIRITAVGAGYTTAGYVITTGTGAGFVGEAVIISGGVYGIIVVNGGHDYRPDPTDTIAITGDGVGATAVLVVGPLTGTYPSVVSYYQERRVYAGTNNNPDTYWMSVPGQFRNFDSAIPVEPDDAITGTPWSQQVNGIQWMIPEPGGLVTLTGRGAWQVTGQGGSALNPQPLTPGSQQAQPQTFSGTSSVVPPITINNDILYVQEKGSAVRDMVYNYLTNNYTGSDQTVLSGHLFTGYTVHEWAWCEEPYKIIWAVRNDGVLLSFTYLKEQEVFGWARHDTQGRFVSVTSVSEVAENQRGVSPTGSNNPLVTVDALYVAVERFTPNGPVYFIERMDDRFWTAAEDPWCVDCALRYTQSRPGGSIYANALSGAVTFTSLAGVFVALDVGQVLRIGGGIATISTYTSANLISGTWVLPPTGYVPGVVSAVQFLLPDQWTITAPITAVSGLEHLAGLSVTGLADGVVVGPFTVSAGGTVTLPFAASAITLGLAFTAQIQSPYLDAGSPTVQGRRKNIIAVTGRVEASQGVEVGANQPDGSIQQPPQIAPTWTEMQPTAPTDTLYTPATYLSPAGQVVQQLYTGDIRAPVDSDWQVPGQIAFQQTGPRPLNLLALIPELLEGDVTETAYTPERQDGRRAPGNWMLQR